MGKDKLPKVRVVAASFARLCSQPGETLRCQLTCPALQQGCHSTWPAGWSAATLSWPAIFQHREPWSIPGVDPAPQGSRSSQLEPLQHLAQGSALRQAGLGHCTLLATAGLLSLKGFLLLSLEGTEPSRSLFVFCDLSKPSNLLNVHSCQD